MAELAVECPPPEGHVGNQRAPTPRSDPQTNLRIREFLKKHHKPTSNANMVDSENSNDDQQRQQSNQSPPPNCSICLSRVKSKCFTDSCMHQFCFSCLLEWSKVKPECPLCKQTFKSIIHNVTSMDKYEEYKVEAQQGHVSWINITPFQSVDVDMNFLLQATIPSYSYPAEPRAASRRRIAQLLRNDTAMVERFTHSFPNEMFQGRLSGSQWRSYIYFRRLYAEPLNDLGGQSREISAAFLRANPAQAHRLTAWLNREVVSLCAQQPPLTVSYTVQRIEHLYQTYDMTSQDFRSRIRQLLPTHADHFIHELINFARSPYDMIGYDRYVTYSARTEPESNEMETVSLSSASEEGSDVEWIGPIVDVETLDVTPGTSSTSSSSTTMNTIDSIVDITTVASIINVDVAGTSTSTSTSTSSSTSSATLTEINQTSIQSSGLLLNDSDDEELTDFLLHGPHITAEEMIIGRTGPLPNELEQQISPESPNQETVTIDRIESGTEQINETLASTSQWDVQETIQPSTSSQSIEPMPLATPKAEPNTEPNETEARNEVINADDSDSDECLFVCAKKPPHLRTPEYVELNSDSDSDVVFVSSEKNTETVKPSVSSLDIMAKNRSALSIQGNADVGTQCGSSTNIIISNSRRKRSRNNMEIPINNTRQCTSARVFDVKPTTSEKMQQWLITDPQKSNIVKQLKSSAIIRPRTRTTIKISRGKRIYESPSSSDVSDIDEKPKQSGASNSSDSTSFSDCSDDESSSHEEYSSTLRPRIKKRVEKMPQRKRLRRRHGKQIYENSSSTDEDSDTDDQTYSNANAQKFKS